MAGFAFHVVALIGAFIVLSIDAAILVPLLETGEPVPAFVIALLSLMSVCVAALFLVASAITRHKTWGRYVGIACGVISLPSFPVGTAIGAYILWLLVFGWAVGSRRA